MGVALRTVVIIGFLAKEFGVPIRIPHFDLLAGISGPPTALNVIEELDNRSGLWPAGLMAMKAPVRIIEADDLTNFATLLLKHYGSPYLKTQTAHTQNNFTWDSIGW